MRFLAEKICHVKPCCFLKSESQLEDSSSRNYQQSNTRQDSKSKCLRMMHVRQTFPHFSHLLSCRQQLKKKKKKSALTRKISLKNCPICKIRVSSRSLRKPSESWVLVMMNIKHWRLISLVYFAFSFFFQKNHRKMLYFSNSVEVFFTKIFFQITLEILV